MLLESILLVSISPAIITTEECTKQKERAEFIVETSKYISEEEMRRLFPRHIHIIHEIYNTEYPEYIVPNWVYRNCMEDAAV